MTGVVFLRLAPWMGVLHPHPQDTPYAYDIAQAAAFLSADKYEINFIDGIVENLTVDAMIKKISAIKPQVLALTATSSVERFAIDIFSRIKAYLPEVYLVGFGQHAHYSPQSFLSPTIQVDACVYGESELTLVELIKVMPRTHSEKEKIKGIYYWDGGLRQTPERQLITDLTRWPMPRYEIFKNHTYRLVSVNFPSFRRLKPGWILASRGCPYQCTICSPAIRRSFGTQLRKSSPERIADTFKLLDKEVGVNTVYFADDVFTLDMDWVEKICDELIKINNGVQWGMCTRVDRLSSELIKKMKAAGLCSVAMGIESGSGRILQDINKKINLGQIEWALSELEKNNISVNVTAIVGHVDETIDELRQTLSFLKKSKALFIQLHYLSPYPGTKVAQVFKDRLGVLEDISHFNVRPMNVSKIPDMVLSGSIQKFYLNYYTSWGFIKKYIRYRLPYVLSNPIKEARLIKDSFAYFLLSARDKKRKTIIKEDNMKVFVPRQSISISWSEFFKSILRLPFKSGYGKDVLNWEKTFADFIGVPYAISFISERAGTYFALKALREMNNWDSPEIICPSYTFFSVPWAAKLAGWKLRFADVLREDLNIDPKSLRRQINEKTKAIIVTHLNGKPCRIKEIEQIARNNNLRLLEDCAHAIGIEADSKQVGAWDIGCFSFGDGKNLGTFCGGMITTSDPQLAKILRNKVCEFPGQPQLHILKKIFDSFLLKILTTGIFYPLFLYPLLRWLRYLSADSRKNDFLNFIKSKTEKDLTYKFSDLQALVGLSQLVKLNKRNEIRRANARAFRSRLSQKALGRMLPWDGCQAHAMLHDAIVLKDGMNMAKNSLLRGIDVRLDYCGNCRNLPGMENFPAEDEVGRSIDGKVFFIPNHLNMNSSLSEKTSIILDNLLII